jgi:penicillin V acylase-like amidase (Ntn superfamily)
MMRQLLATSVLATALWAASPTGQACTRVLWNDNGAAVVVARTMDQQKPDHAQIVFSPEGTARDGMPGTVGSLKWTSRYAMVAVLSFGATITDGMNEKGLSVQSLWLDATEYEKSDDRPVVSYNHWVEFMLDNFQTVNEALGSLATFRLVPETIHDAIAPLHFCLEDASGDSAIIEYVNGKMAVYHGHEYTVMTNEPTLPEQLANLKRYRLFGGDLPMPGDVDPVSRFVRASSYLKTLPKPQDDLEAVAGIYSVIRTVAVPFGAQDTSGNNPKYGWPMDGWPTLWFTLSDLTNKVFYFQATNNPHAFWVEFKNLPTEKGSPLLKIDANDKTLVGEISGSLKAHPAE